VAWRVQRLELDRLAHLDDIARAQAAGHVGDLVLGILVRQDLRAGFCDQSLVAARMVAMFVCVETLCSPPIKNPAELEKQVAEIKKLAAEVQQ
jgi:hypothetical protein